MKHLDLAKKIIQTLSDAGYTAFFAGGWVRDYLMGRPSNDVDIATSATPEEVEALFPRTLKVGAAFGVVVVLLEGEQFEVASFRTEGRYLDGRKPESVAYASPEEDAQRRDFTINGIFYDPLKDQILDFVGGQEDIQTGVIRAIGRAGERFVEDRLRMLRAVRFAVRFGFRIDGDTEAAILKSASTLFPAVSVERVWQEFQKMHAFPGFEEAICALHRLGLLGEIFSELQGLDNRDLLQRIAPCKHFPAGVPLIISLAQLFPQADLDTLFSLVDEMRGSNQDKRALSVWMEARRLADRSREGDIESVEWARLLAKDLGETMLRVVAVTLPQDRIDGFLDLVETRSLQLEKAIHRMQMRTPVISSRLLKQEGVTPGPLMGDLLKEAERLSVNLQLEDPDEVMVHLRRSPLWEDR